MELPGQKGPNEATQNVLDSGENPRDAAIKAARSGDLGAQEALDSAGFEWRTMNHDPIEETQGKPFGGRDRQAEFEAIKKAQEERRRAGK